jgi:hypothetical protein
MMQETRLYLQHRNNWTDEQADEKVVYLPNFYPQDFVRKPLNKDKDTIDVCCFGAIRPLKNHLLQAVAAIGFADEIGKKLRFHVNAGRIEMQGSPVLNNLKGVFQQIADSGHQLVNQQWRPREEFLELCSEMDIAMQTNFSETFNIVGADVISQGVPLVGNHKEIPWAVGFFSADPNNSKEIVKKLHLAYNWPQANVIAQQASLKSYTNKTAKIWHKYFS